MTTLVDAAFLRDPYPYYHALREQGPIHWNEEFCGGAWLLTDYADVAQVLRDQAFSVKRAGSWANSAGTGAREQLRPFKAIFARSLLFLDQPQHTRLRQVMNAGFKPAVIQGMRPLITDIVDNLLDDLQGELCDDFRDAPSDDAVTRAPVDFISRFARQLPARVIADMLGVDQADRADFIAWSDDVAAFVGSPAPTMEIALQAQDSLVALNAYFEAILPERRHNPGADLVSRLIEAEAQRLVVTTRELLAQCCTLLFAGHETTRNLLGNGLLTLLQHPAQRQELQDNPALMQLALKELLRFESPVQYTGRTAKTDIALHGKQIRKGDLLIPLIGAANRDPKKFNAPDRFDIRRDEGNHLSFGIGPHVCIGATLTYLEAEIAFTALMRRVPGLQLVEGEPQWGTNAVYRSLRTLPLQLNTHPVAAPADVMAA